MINLGKLVGNLDATMAVLGTAIADINAMAEQEISKRKDRTAQILELDARILELRKDCALKGWRFEKYNGPRDEHLELLATEYVTAAHELARLGELHGLLVSEDFHDSQWQYDPRFQSWGRFFASSLGYFSGRKEADDKPEGEPIK